MVCLHNSKIAAIAQPQQAAARLYVPQADVVEARVDLEVAEFGGNHVLRPQVVVRTDGGVVARVAGTRGDPGTRVGAMLRTRRSPRKRRASRRPVRRRATVPRRAGRSKCPMRAGSRRCRA